MTEEPLTEEELETGTQLLVQAVGHLLEDYEGIVVHLDGEGYCLWKDPKAGRIEVMQDDEYLTVASGLKTWMHEDGSTAPEPGPEDHVLGDIPPKKLH